MKCAKLLTLLAALALGVASARAADTPPATAEPAPSTSAPSLTVPATSVTPLPGAQPIAYQKGSSTATLTLYLVLLLALFGGGAYLVRNGFTLFQPKMKGVRKLQISETRMLGNRQFLVVAEYEDRKMLLGVCPGRIDYLATLSAREAEFSAIESEKDDE